MDNEVFEKMLARVRGLLALAEDEGATPAEAELATQRAAEIMAKYKIDAILLTAKSDVREIPCDKIVRFPDPYGKQHMFLYVGVLRAFGGDAVLIDHNRRRSGKHGRRSYNENNGCALHVYGFEADLMVVDVLYTSLLLQGINQAKIVPSYENARSWRVSFWAGFTDTVSDRLQMIHRKVEAQGKPGTALVLRDRNAAVEARKVQDYPKLRKYAGSSATSVNGYESGQDAGTRANLHDKTQTGGAKHYALT